MKRLISLLITISIMLSFTTFIDVSASEKVMLYEGFEDGTSSVEIKSDYSKEHIKEDSETYSEGKNSLNLVDDSEETGPAVELPKIEIDEGETYTFATDFFVVSGSSIRMYFRYYDAEEKIITNTSVTPSGVGKWVVVKRQAEAPEGAVYAQIIITGNKATKDSEVYVDNVRIYKGAVEVSAPANGVVGEKAKKAVAAAPTTTTTTETVEKSPVVRYSDDVKTLFSESFENGFEEWKPNSAEGIDIKESTEHTTDGKKSVYMLDETTKSSPCIKSPSIKIEPGKTYTAYADFFPISGNSVSIFIKFYNEAGKQVATASKTPKTAGKNNITGIALGAPKNATHAQVWICGYSNRLGECYVDNLFLYEGNILKTTVYETFVPPVQKEAVESKIIAPKDGKLQYTPYNEEGDIVGDYSYAGFHSGDYNLPESKNLPVAVTISPLGDGKDDTDNIQAAIDNAYKMSYGNMVLVKLKAGRYHVGKKGLTMRSGVILSGEGQSSEGTVIYAYAPSTYNVINISGEAPRVIGETAFITDKYVKSGSRTFNIEENKISSFKVGDLIELSYECTDEFSKYIEMDSITGSQKQDNSWKKGSWKVSDERIITAINGSKITVDIPFYVPYLTELTPVSVYKITDDGKIRNTGVENLRVESYYNGDPEDENHASVAVNVKNAVDVFIRNVTTKYMAHALVTAGVRTKRMTVENCSCIEPVSIVEGGNRYSYAVSTSTTQFLCTGSYSHAGRHDYVSSFTSTGPIVFSDNVADRSLSASEAHGTWSTGLLYDNVYQIGHDTIGLTALVNRGIYGTTTSQGWSSAGSVMWNCLSPTLMANKLPKTYQNFMVGIWGHYNTPSSQTIKNAMMGTYKAIYRTTSNPGPKDEFYPTSNDTSMIGDSYKEAETTSVEPRSLYRAQLAEKHTGSITNAKPNAPIIVKPEYDESSETGSITISGVYQLGAQKVTIYIDDNPYEAKMNSADNSFELTLSLADGTHKIYATQTINGVESTKNADRFITAKKSTGYNQYLSSEYPLDKTSVLVNDPRPSYDKVEEELVSKFNNKIRIYVNEKLLYPDVEPMLINSRTVVPLRVIFEALGAKVYWDDPTQTATAISGFGEVKITNDSTTAYVNKNPVTLDVPATIISGRFLVPVRFVSEALGAEVAWNDKKQTVDITRDGFATSHGLEGELFIQGAVASGDGGIENTVDKMFDHDFTSSWTMQYNAANPEASYVIYDLGVLAEIKSMYMAYSKGNQRVYVCDIYVSDDNKNFTIIKRDNKSSGETLELEEIPLNAKGRYVKVVYKGNSVNLWNNVMETAFTGK